MGLGVCSTGTAHGRSPGAVPHPPEKGGAQGTRQPTVLATGAASPPAPPVPGIAAVGLWRTSIPPCGPIPLRQKNWTRLAKASKSRSHSWPEPFKSQKEQQVVCQGQPQFFHQGPSQLLGQLPVDPGKPVALPPFPQGEQFRGVIPRLFLGVVFPFAVGGQRSPAAPVPGCTPWAKNRRWLAGGAPPAGKTAPGSRTPGLSPAAHHLAAGLGGELVLET